MRENTLQKRKFSSALCVEWLQKDGQFREMQKRAILEYAETHVGKTEELYELYQGILEGKSCKTELLELEMNGERAELKVMNQQIQKSLEEIKTILQNMILILEDTLPLGSVVELDLSECGIESEIPLTNVKVLIVDRFMRKEKENFYVPYCGVVYPFGNTKKQLFFTKKGVTSIVSRGYEDEQENAFIAGMKRELLKKGFQSYIFATTGE